MISVFRVMMLMSSFVLACFVIFFLKRWLGDWWQKKILRYSVYTLLFISVTPRLMPRNMSIGPAGHAGSILMGFFAQLLFVAVLLEVGTGLKYLWKKWAKKKIPANPKPRQDDGPENQERRAFMKKMVGSSVIGAAGVGAGVGLWQCTDFKITPVDITAKNLPPGFHGSRWVQVSDLHVGPYIRRSEVEKIVATIKNLAPDGVFFTGDMLDGKLEDLRDDFLPFKDLSALMPCYFCLGNHEYYWGAMEWVRFFEEELGWVILINRATTHRKNGEEIIIAGVADSTGDRIEGTPRIEWDKLKASKSALEKGPNDFSVLLAHKPLMIKDWPDTGLKFDLQASGHTHAGQFFPFNFVVKLVQPYLGGLYQVGETQLYVNRATGFWGPPNRFLIPRELTVFTFKLDS